MDYEINHAAIARELDRIGPYVSTETGETVTGDTYRAQHGICAHPAYLYVTLWATDGDGDYRVGVASCCDCGKEMGRVMLGRSANGGWAV